LGGGPVLNYGALTTDQGVESGSVAHRRAWEAGHIDYQGKDSFDNIQEQLEKNIAQQPQQYHPSQQRRTTPPSSTSASAVPTNDNDQTAIPIAGVLKTTTITTTTETKTE